MHELFQADLNSFHRHFKSSLHRALERELVPANPTPTLILTLEFLKTQGWLETTLLMENLFIAKRLDAGPSAHRQY